MSQVSAVYGFFVQHAGERESGTHNYTDEVFVSVDSGDPGGEPGEFQEFMRECLAQWFDGAAVEDWPAAMKRIAAENALMDDQP